MAWNDGSFETREPWNFHDLLSKEKLESLANQESFWALKISKLASKRTPKWFQSNVDFVCETYDACWARDARILKEFLSSKKIYKSALKISIPIPSNQSRTGHQNCFNSKSFWILRNLLKKTCRVCLEQDKKSNLRTQKPKQPSSSSLESRVKKVTLCMCFSWNCTLKWVLSPPFPK